MKDQLGLGVFHTASLYPWQLQTRPRGPSADSSIPSDAASWLKPDNPRLLELQARYDAFDHRVTAPSAWTGNRLSAEDLLYFRGDNAFVWQVRGPNRNELSYALCYYALKADDPEDLIGRLGDDASFGVHHFTIDDRIITRDLLDSIREIQFLKRHASLGERSCNILDIGAGYGRLAYRLNQATPDTVRIFATDAYAPSTFISEYYLRYRQASRATVIPLDEVETLLAGTRIEVATNVHSFAECTTDAIAWWVERLARYHVKYLMVVPNEGKASGARCQTSDGIDIEPIFSHFGYRAIVREPRYPDAVVQLYGIDPVHLHLFELNR